MAKYYLTIEALEWYTIGISETPTKFTIHKTDFLTFLKVFPEYEEKVRNQKANTICMLMEHNKSVTGYPYRDVKIGVTKYLNGECVWIVDTTHPYHCREIFIPIRIFKKLIKNPEIGTQY